MKSPIAIFTEQAAGSLDIQGVTSLLLAITQELYLEIEKLRAGPPPIVGNVQTSFGDTPR